MKNILLLMIFPLIIIACENNSIKIPPDGHPDSAQWRNLFQADLSDAHFSEGIWSFDNGILTATEDQCIWTEAIYDNFALDLEFMTEAGTNSGVIVYCSDTDDWIPNAIEIQIADDYAEQWANAEKTWQCGAFFGHLAPDTSLVKRPGEWNRFTIICKDYMIYVVLNGQMVNKIDLRKWTSGTQNPDGSAIPAWLDRPWAELATKGHIGLQGKHAGANIFFRNLKIKEIDK
jgi:hypothetical protein